MIDELRHRYGSETGRNVTMVTFPKPNPTPWQNDNKVRHWFRGERGVHISHIYSSPAEWCDISEMLRLIKIKPVFGMQFLFELGEKCNTALGEAWMIFIHVSVPHREVEEPQRTVTLRFPIAVLCTAFLGRIRLAQVMREALIEWVIPHEVDEMIEMDGERVFDPHAPGGMDW